ncbi:hypothetical protein ACH5RR_033692 [Cinchona calisaya]|uniref:RNase H type-1 domain-containing protein n=1 Tax=Cinchona calisaya TaxID=153742 RepID=A0ABD2Y9Z3_9GENT
MGEDSPVLNSKDMQLSLSESMSISSNMGEVRVAEPVEDEMLIDEDLSRQQVMGQVKIGLICESYQVCKKAIEEWLEFRQVEKPREREGWEGERSAPEEKWLHPAPGKIRVNVDAALKLQETKVAWGIVASDEAGKLIKAWGIPKSECSNPKMKEANTIRMALVKACEEQWKQIEVQSDYKSVVDHINRKNTNYAVIEYILKDSVDMQNGFINCKYLLIRRSGNSVGHKLAQFAINLSKEVIWVTSFPCWLEMAAKEDL